MDLQYALLFIGIVIVAIVALTTYDMARLRQPRSRPDPSGFTMKHPCAPAC
jgi:hypothetical protein